jgi:hypothetical protein
MAMLPRIVFRNVYSANNEHNPAVVHTPCIPVLLQVSHESRQIALENYELVRARNSNPSALPGPMYFNSKLDTLICAEWDGTYLSFTDHERFPKRILKQAREVCWYVSEIFQLIETIDEYEWPNRSEDEKRPILDKVYEFFRGFENLETCLLTSLRARTTKRSGALGKLRFSMWLNG